MQLTDDELRLVMLLIELSCLPEPEKSSAWELLAKIQRYRAATFESSK